MWTCGRESHKTGWYISCSGSYHYHSVFKNEVIDIKELRGEVHSQDNITRWISIIICVVIVIGIIITRLSYFFFWASLHHAADASKGESTCYIIDESFAVHVIKTSQRKDCWVLFYILCKSKITLR